MLHRYPVFGKLLQRPTPTKATEPRHLLPAEGRVRFVVGGVAVEVGHAGLDALGKDNSYRLTEAIPPMKERKVILPRW